MDSVRKSRIDTFPLRPVAGQAVKKAFRFFLQQIHETAAREKVRTRRAQRMHALTNGQQLLSQTPDGASDQEESTSQTQPIPSPGDRETLALASTCDRRTLRSEDMVRLVRGLGLSITRKLVRSMCAELASRKMRPLEQSLPPHQRSLRAGVHPTESFITRTRHIPHSVGEISVEDLTWAVRVIRTRDARNIRDRHRRTESAFARSRRAWTFSWEAVSPHRDAWLTLITHALQTIGKRRTSEIGGNVTPLRQSALRELFARPSSTQKQQQHRPSTAPAPARTAQASTGSAGVRSRPTDSWEQYRLHRGVEQQNAVIRRNDPRLELYSQLSSKASEHKSAGSDDDAEQPESVPLTLHNSVDYYRDSATKLKILCQASMNKTQTARPQPSSQTPRPPSPDPLPSATRQIHRPHTAVSFADRTRFQAALYMHDPSASLRQQRKLTSFRDGTKTQASRTQEKARDNEEKRWGRLVRSFNTGSPEAKRPAGPPRFVTHFHRESAADVRARVAHSQQQLASDFPPLSLLRRGANHAHNSSDGLRDCVQSLACTLRDGLGAHTLSSTEASVRGVVLRGTARRGMQAGAGGSKFSQLQLCGKEAIYDSAALLAWAPPIPAQEWKTMAEQVRIRQAQQEGAMQPHGGWRPADHQSEPPTGQATPTTQRRRHHRTLTASQMHDAVYGKLASVKTARSSRSRTALHVPKHRRKALNPASKMEETARQTQALLFTSSFT